MSHMFIFYTHSHIQLMFLDLRRWVDVGGRNLSDNNRENGCERQNTFFWQEPATTVRLCFVHGRNEKKVQKRQSYVG